MSETEQYRFTFRCTVCGRVESVWRAKSLPYHEEPTAPACSGDAVPHTAQPMIRPPRRGRPIRVERYGDAPLFTF